MPARPHGLMAVRWPLGAVSVASLALGCHQASEKEKLHHPAMRIPRDSGRPSVQRVPWRFISGLEEGLETAANLSVCPVIALS